MRFRLVRFCGGLGLLFWACANIRAPGGGPPDTHPPQLKAWHSYTDKKGRPHYKLRWNEFLDLGGEALPTLAWVNPMPSDTLPELRRRIRGKRLVIVVPESCAQTMLWLGPAVRDFTEKNPILSTPLVSDTQAHILRLTPSPGGKHPTWLLIRGKNGVYRFLAQGDSILIAHMPDLAAPAYAFEDGNGNALWDGATESVWLPEETDSSFLGVRWVRLLLDTLAPRPNRSLNLGSYVLLTFSEPVRVEGAAISLAENALLTGDTTLALYDSLDYAYLWRRPDPALLDSVLPPLPLFWPWYLNSRSPWLYLSVPDTAIRSDTFLYLREEQTDRLLPLCQERYLLSLPPQDKFSEAILNRGSSNPQRLPLRKAPVILRGDSLRTRQGFRLYPPPILNNDSPFLVSENDTLWLVPGRYKLSPADRPSPHISLNERWPYLRGSPQNAREITVLAVDSLQVFYLNSSPEP